MGGCGFATVAGFAGAGLAMGLFCPETRLTVAINIAQVSIKMMLRIFGAKLWFLEFGFE